MTKKKETSSSLSSTVNTEKVSCFHSYSIFSQRVFSRFRSAILLTWLLIKPVVSMSGYKEWFGENACLSCSKLAVFYQYWRRGKFNFDK